MPDLIVYKILSAAELNQLQRDGAFTGSPVDIADGYIHGRGAFCESMRYYGTVAAGFSPTMWSDKHNRHHALTNEMGQDEDLLLRARIQGWKPSVPWRIAHAAHELERVAEELRATGSEYEEAQYLLEEAVGRAEIALTRVLLIGNPYLREKSRPEAPNAD